MVSSLEKNDIINSLEDLVVKIRYDPTDVNAAKKIIKEKNLDFSALRNQLKLPVTEGPLTKDLEENKAQKANIMKLIIE